MDEITIKNERTTPKKMSKSRLAEQTFGGFITGALLGSGIEDLFDLEPGATLCFLETAKK